MKKILNYFGLYTEKQLTSFGEYMVSENRNELLFEHTEKDMIGLETYYQRRTYVSHADFENWKVND
jgi:hypothetical protein